MQTQYITTYILTFDQKIFTLKLLIGRRVVSSILPFVVKQTVTLLLELEIIRVSLI